MSLNNTLWTKFSKLMNTLTPVDNVIGEVSEGGLAPQTLDHGQYFALILFKLHEIW